MIVDADLGRLDRMTAVAHGAIVRDAARLIVGGVGDARAHAAVALTATLAKAGEGRPTIARARNHPSVVAAGRRLEELAGRLAGLVRDARHDRYGAAWKFWAARVDGTMLRRGVDPDDPPASYLARFVALPWHGATIEQFCRGPARPLAVALAQAVARAGMRGKTPREQADQLDAWERRATNAFLRVASGLAADAVTLADRIAGRDMIRPELLEPDPTIPWDEAR